MNRSVLIRVLLNQFPMLKPKQIERLLGERGIAVDANLIGLARLRLRRAKQAEQAVSRLLNKLLEKRPDLRPPLPIIYEDLWKMLSEAVAADQGLLEEEIVERLAVALPLQPPQEDIAARASRILQQVLNEHPQYRQSLLMAIGVGRRTPSPIEVEVTNDDLTDEQLKAGILKFLENTYPVGPTVETIARSFIDKVKERIERDRAAQEHADLATRDRAETILISVTGRLRSPLSDREAAYAVVQQFVMEYADWSDEDIADRIVAGLEHAQRPVERRKKVNARHIEGLTIRSRP